MISKQHRVLREGKKSKAITEHQHRCRLCEKWFKVDSPDKGTAKKNKAGQKVTTKRGPWTCGDCTGLQRVRTAKQDPKEMFKRMMVQKGEKKEAS
jgi:hypothetical protein